MWRYDGFSQQMSTTTSRKQTFGVDGAEISREIDPPRTLQVEISRQWLMMAIVSATIEGNLFTPHVAAAQCTFVIEKAPKGYSY
jgi:hypothetical protein